MVPDLAERTGAYLVGGLSSSRSLFPQVAGRPAEDGVSGALFTGAVGVVTGLSQGCVPLGPPRQVTKAHGHTVMEIDGRRALDVLQADVMPVLAGSPGAMAGGLFIGLPIPGSDTGDYLVRDIVGADETTGAIQVRALVDPGAALLFCRRDRDSAAADMDRMLTTLSRRMKGPPQGGIYVGCLARGRHLFGREGAELAMIRERLGDFPLTGFFAAGEIANARFYTHTGVLTLFT
jgi:small ligand-binding sensory domain FIST